MADDIQKLIKKHPGLVHSEMLKVNSHVQTRDGEWYTNTIMVDGYNVPFKYKRKQQYKSLEGQRVNMSYYPDVQCVAGLDFEIMKVVRIRVA